MTTTLFVLVLLVLLVHGYREYWTRRSLEQASMGVFEGEFFQVGKTLIVRRQARSAIAKTIICFPGFLEDMRYFQALYEDFDGELILVNNADYHCPFRSDSVLQLHWPENPFPLGTIEHDGYYLGRVISELASGSEIVLHGHSRGGAVVLETGRQYPQLTGDGDKKIVALLEAAVLPGGRMVGKGSESVPHALICYLMPVVLGLSRKSGEAQLLKQPMMRPTNALKTRICSTIYTNPIHYSTCVVNARSIRQWQLQQPFDLYKNFSCIQVVVGERDDVLDNRTMLASAEQGQQLNPGVDILRTRNTNHFVSLEQPEFMRALTTC
jgi:pimeloyl-ACP methyl ester carboxylesterase